MIKLEDYPRAVVVEALNHDDQVAWLRPFAVIEDIYLRRLPDEACGEFGVDFQTLLAKKGLETRLGVGDAFRTYNPEHPETITFKDGKLEVIGEYLPITDTL